MQPENIWEGRNAYIKYLLFANCICIFLSPSLSLLVYFISALLSALYICFSCPSIARTASDNFTCLMSHLTVCRRMRLGRKQIAISVQLSQLQFHLTTSPHPPPERGNNTSPHAFSLLGICHGNAVVLGFLAMGFLGIVGIAGATR